MAGREYPAGTGNLSGVTATIHREGLSGSSGTWAYWLRARVPGRTAGSGDCDGDGDDGTGDNGDGDDGSGDGDGDGSRVPDEVK